MLIIIFFLTHNRFSLSVCSRIVLIQTARNALPVYFTDVFQLVPIFKFIQIYSKRLLEFEITSK